MIQKLRDRILAANSFILSTHRHCDGDGLGAQLALFHGLKKLGKDVRLVNVDATPKKYGFLPGISDVEVYEGTHSPIEPTDLALIFDTNDRRLLEPLFSELQRYCKDIVFVDHHPPLKKGPAPTTASWIDIGASSTGEMAYRLIEALKIPMDAEMAQTLYTSIAFDTQVFRYVRNSPASHLIAAELLKYDFDPARIHQYLFGNFTPQKLHLLADIARRIHYECAYQIAFIAVRAKDLEDQGLSADESRDIIDWVMNVESLEVAALLREDKTGHFKLSLRSKGRVPVLSIAEGLGGGGHDHAAGASVKGTLSKLRTQILDELKDQLKKLQSESA